MHWQKMLNPAPLTPRNITTKKSLNLVIDLDFEEILKQNERRIYYHMHRLGIRDFYAGGLFALWMAYKKYEPDKGPLATYFNFMIRNRLIDKIRQESRVQENKERYADNAKKLFHIHNGENGMSGNPQIVHGAIGRK